MTSAKTRTPKNPTPESPNPETEESVTATETIDPTEVEMVETVDPTIKRGPGRPKGSPANPVDPEVLRAKIEAAKETLTAVAVRNSPNAVIAVEDVAVLRETLQQLGTLSNQRTVIDEWMTTAFLDEDITRVTLGAVYVASKPTTGPAASTIPDHVKLAYRLCILKAATQFIVGTNSDDEFLTQAGAEMYDRAVAVMGQPDFRLPDHLADKVDAVVVAACKGTRSRGRAAGSTG
jgi:hypothetical protein